jgi:DNA-binding transcriptional regulator GbsR (MarR family)
LSEQPWYKRRVPPEHDARDEVWRSEVLVSDAIGRLIEFWGFKRNMGRIWAVLYLSDQALSAQELQHRLQLSAGAVSMTLKSLGQWRVVRRVWVQGERRDYFEAEGNFWRMISRVFEERERREILDAIDVMEEALEHLRVRLETCEGKERARAEVQVARIEQLLDLARLGQSLLDRLLKSAQVDASPLLRVLLGAASRNDHD